MFVSMTWYQIWFYYYSLPSIMIGVLVFVYHIDKMYKKPLTDQGKGYNILKGGVYNKTKGRN
jgi:hypothetical protein